jgi:hypothetical protein
MADKVKTSKFDKGDAFERQSQLSSETTELKQNNGKQSGLEGKANKGDEEKKK